MSGLYGFAVAALVSYILGSVSGEWVASLLKRVALAAGFDPDRLSHMCGRMGRRLRPALREIPLVIANSLKGLVAAAVAWRVLESQMGAFVAGVFVTLGHMAPFLGLRPRQKGIAVAMGAMALVAAESLCAMLGLWVVSFAITKYTSVSWVLSFGALPVIMYLVRRRDVFVIYGIMMSAMAVIQMAGGLARISLGRVRHREDTPFVDEEDEDTADEDEPLRRKRTGLRLAAGVIATMTAVLWFGNKYVYRGFGVQVDVIRSGSPNLRVVALTFDDGPDPVYTPEILDILKGNGVPATFFLVGKHVEKYPEVARRIALEGHSIGNHTYSHVNMPLLTRDRAVSEIDRAEKAIQAACGIRPHLFRPPRGLAGEAMRSLLRDDKYTIVLWDLSSRDWAEPSHWEIVSTCGRARNGGIILFHDSGSLLTSEGGSRENTVRALPIIIKNLKEKGFRFVTIDELIVLSDLDPASEVSSKAVNGETP